MRSPSLNHALKSEIAFCVQGVISPLLANIFLHYVFDLWAHEWRQRQAHGATIVVRYADDTVVGFEHRADAERFLAEVRERMAAWTWKCTPRRHV